MGSRFLRLQIILYPLAASSVSLDIKSGWPHEFRALQNASDPQISTLASNQDKQLKHGSDYRTEILSSGRAIHGVVSHNGATSLVRRQPVNDERSLAQDGRAQQMIEGRKVEPSNDERSLAQDERAQQMREGRKVEPIETSSEMIEGHPYMPFNPQVAQGLNELWATLFSPMMSYDAGSANFTEKATLFSPMHFLYWFTRIGATVLLFAVLIFFIYRGTASSAVDDNDSQAHHPLQAILLLYIVTFMSSVTVVIPSSYALMRDLGLGATSSGWLIGCAWPLSSVVALLMKPLLQDWNQSTVRLVLLLNYCLQIVAAFAFALASDPPEMFGEADPTARLAVLLVSRLMVGVSGGSDLLLNVMVWKILPAKHTVGLEVSKVCSRTLAIGLGPILFSLITWTTSASNARTYASHPAYAFAFFWFIFTIIASVVIPKDLDPLIQAKEVEDDRTSQGEDNSAQANNVSFDVRQLPEETRRSIWFSGMLYGFERALMVSALEAATSLIIEMEFQWNIRDVGLAVGLTFFVGLPVTLVLNIARKRGMISEAKLMSGASITAFVASIFLFPSVAVAFGVQPWSWGAVALVLAADCFIFPSGYLANGIIDGLAVQSSLPGTFCSMENFRLLESILQDSLARLTAPALARYLISSHGRGAYSIFQVCASSIGCLTCLSVASKLRLPLQSSTSAASSTEKQSRSGSPSQGSSEAPNRGLLDRSPSPSAPNRRPSGAKGSGISASSSG